MQADYRRMSLAHVILPWIFSYFLLILYPGHLCKSVSEEGALLFQDHEVQLLITENCSPGSGDILNDTLEEVRTMNRVPITDPGSGDGAFLHVTGEVSE